MPSVTLTEAEIEKVREIAILADYDEAVTLCAAKLVNDSQRTSVKEDIVQWAKVRINVNDVVPNSQSEFSVIRERKRKLLRWTMRMRLGLPPVSDEESAMDAAINGAAGGRSMSMGTMRMQTGRGSRSTSEF